MTRAHGTPPGRLHGLALAAAPRLHGLALAAAPRLLGLALAAAPMAAGAAQEPAPSEVVSVLVGAGGSFGRGVQSARLELQLARRAGVQAIFWTACDALLEPGREVAHFPLDAPVEPLDAGEDWTALPELERGVEKRVVVQETRLASRPSTREERALANEPLQAEHAFDRVDSRDGSPSLRISVEGSNTEAFRGLAAQLVADRGAHRRALALDVRARLFVLPLEQSDDSRAFAEFRLSEQPIAAHGRGVGQDALHYFLSNRGEPVTAEGGTVFIPVPYEPGVWNELSLELSADALAHTAGGHDNLLHQIRLGVESRFQAPGAARFDALSLEQDQIGAAALERQGQVLRGLGGEDGLDPALALQGLCSDVLRHATLFELGPRAAPNDYRALLAEPGAGDAAGAELLAALVARAHGRGSLVARGNPLAPPFDRPAGEAARLEELRAERLGGADLLLFDPAPETFADQLALWDGLAEGGLFPVGLGAGGELGGRWHALSPGVQGLVSFVLAGSTDQDDLLAALAGGRVAFGDPGGFRGGLDLESERGFAMGQVVLTDRASASVSLRRLGPPAEGEVVDWYTSRGLADSHDLDAPRPLSLETLPDFARAVVRDGRARPVAFSNALHFVRAFPPEGLPAERAALDVAGVRSRAGARLRLFDARALEHGRGLVIAAQASGDGTLELSLGEAQTASLAWDGLRGTARQEGERVHLRDLDGRGTVTLRRER